MLCFDDGHGEKSAPVTCSTARSQGDHVIHFMTRNLPPSSGRFLNRAESHQLSAQVLHRNQMYEKLTKQRQVAKTPCSTDSSALFQLVWQSRKILSQEVGSDRFIAVPSGALCYCKWLIYINIICLELPVRGSIDTFHRQDWGRVKNLHSWNQRAAAQ